METKKNNIITSADYRAKRYLCDVRYVNTVIITVADYGANHYFDDVYYCFTKYDEVLLKSRNMRWLLNRVVDKFTKDGVKLANEVERWTDETDSLCVILRLIGAAR